MDKHFLPKDWQWRPLGSLCQLVNGRAFKPSEWGKAGLPIVRIQNLNDSDKPYNFYDGTVDEKHLIGSGDVLLSWSGTPGTSFGCFLWERGIAVLNQHIFKVHVDTSLCEKLYFIYAVNAALDEMIAQAHGGVGLRHITKIKLEQIELPVAPLVEQRRIVERIKECLSRVDEIKRLRIEAKLEAEYLESALFADLERSAKFPRHKLDTLILDSQNGRSISKADLDPNGQVLTLTAVRDVYLNYSCFKPVKMNKEIAEQFSFATGDVLISRSNTRDLVGLAAIALETPPKGVIYPDLLIKLSADRSKILPEYLAFALRFPSVRDQIQSSARGTSQSMVKISGSSLREVLIPVPKTLDEQEQILNDLRIRHSKAKAIQADLVSSLIEMVQQSILRKAFAGEL